MNREKRVERVKRMKRMNRWTVGAAALAVGWLGIGIGSAAPGQEVAMSKSGADYHSAAYLKAEAAKLLMQAKADKGGSATLALEKYPGHFMNLTVRTRSGAGEVHRDWADVFVAVDGEAEVITGGTLEDRKDGANGESKGTRVVGGTSHRMSKGDVIHISAGVPHQTIVRAGEAFTYFVVKAAVPAGR